MGIDRIGKGGPPVIPDAGGPSGSAGVGGAKGVEKAFSVDRSAAPRAADATQSVDAASPLARLRAGEVDVNGYVDLKVDEATKNLHGLSPTELGDIKQMLREQMVSDPGLADLVRTASGGQTPSPPED